MIPNTPKQSKKSPNMVKIHQNRQITHTFDGGLPIPQSTWYRLPAQHTSSCTFTIREGPFDEIPYDIYDIFCLTNFSTGTQNFVPFRSCGASRDFKPNLFCTIFTLGPNL